MKLILLLLAVVAVALCQEAPQWPEHYFLEIEFELPYANLTHPITVNKSATGMKVSFFDDLDYTIYQFPKGINGEISGRYIYVEKDQQKCVDVTASLEPGEDVSLPVYLPDIAGENWTPSGENLVIDGLLVNKWVLSEDKGDKRNYYEFYVTPNGVPVRWVQRGRSIPFGSHTDNYAIVYRVFKPDWQEPNFAAYPKICSAENMKTSMKTRGSSTLKFHSMLLSNMKRDLPTIEMAAEIHPDFAAWTAQHSKNYNTVEEKLYRQDIFLARQKWVEETNEKAEGRFGVAINHLADRTIDELMTVFGGHKRSEAVREELRMTSENLHEKISENDLPEVVDWRVDGFVDHVRDQAACGSCWTFSLTGMLETRWAIKNKKFIAFSEQSIVDCYWAEDTEETAGSHGCEGGDEDAAARWLRDTKKGVAFLDEYPYIGLDDYCKEDLWHNESMYTVKDVHVVPEADEVALKKALLSGPVAVGIGVDETLLFYSFGILDVPESSELPIVHGVVCTGYGVAMDGTEYFIVRNSWSSFWGNNGYFYVKIGGNQYNIAGDAMYLEFND